MKIKRISKLEYCLTNSELSMIVIRSAEDLEEHFIKSALRTHRLKVRAIKEEEIRESRNKIAIGDEVEVIETEDGYDII